MSYENYLTTANISSLHERGAGISGVSQQSSLVKEKDSILLKFILNTPTMSSMVTVAGTVALVTVPTLLGRGCPILPLTKIIKISKLLEVFLVFRQLSFCFTLCVVIFYLLPQSLYIITISCKILLIHFCISCIINSL